MATTLHLGDCSTDCAQCISNCDCADCNTTEMEICQICFGGYLPENTKEHECPEFYDCGACGEICDAESGTITDSNGAGFYGEFTHKPELCPAQDEICEICTATVSGCDCQRCEDCGTIYKASDAVELLNDENNCADCANGNGE